MVKSRWNRPGIRSQWERVLQDARSYGFTDDELLPPYLDRLTHQTKSSRIFRMVRLAYYLGWLRGLQNADEGFTLVTLSGEEKGK